MFGLTDPLGVLNGAINKFIKSFDHLLEVEKRESKREINAGLLCPLCFSQVPIGTRYCRNDGTEISRICANCNSSNFSAICKVVQPYPLSLAYSPGLTFSSEAVLGWLDLCQLRTALIRSCSCSYSCGMGKGRNVKNSSQLLQGTGGPKGDGNGAAGITA